MFRQVVVQTWADGVTSEQKQALLRALAALRQIPEVVSARGGIDSGYFPGNWGSAAVLDWADRDAARRYAAHPAHQAFIAGHSAPLTGRRAVVQYDWGAGVVSAITTSKCRSAMSRGAASGMSAYWASNQSWNSPRMARGPLPPGGRRRPGTSPRSGPATALAGFDVTAMAVGTRQDLGLVAERASSAGAAAGPVVRGREGWTCDLTDPDGLIVRLYTHERHS